MKPVRDTFEERKAFIIEYLIKQVDLSSETIKALLKIEPIPFQNNLPLTDQNMLRLKDCKKEEEVKTVLSEVFALQSEYEFRNVEKMIQGINSASRGVFNQLNALIWEFKRFENHQYQKDIFFLIEKLKDKKKEINEGMDIAISFLEEWKKHDGKL
ncbi:hypothetical protein [Aneurinibacillus tyrosinisolvens]|uniref:hypothetical protein n=1 Tax=Aneurinibacillus tyrosinisolvens TaxID=1443435 RepID=UPI00063F7E21|nr:hypothetical protein [Aneurinibacillus tyrosinisolvens]